MGIFGRKKLTEAEKERIAKEYNAKQAELAQIKEAELKAAEYAEIKKQPIGAEYSKQRSVFLKIRQSAQIQTARVESRIEKYKDEFKEKYKEAKTEMRKKSIMDSYYAKLSKSATTKSNCQIIIDFCENMIDGLTDKIAEERDGVQVSLEAFSDQIRETGMKLKQARIAHGIKQPEVVDSFTAQVITEDMKGIISEMFGESSICSPADEEEIRATLSNLAASTNVNIQKETNNTIDSLINELQANTGK